MKYRILLLDTKPSNPNHYICLGIYDALKKHPDVEFVYKASFGDAVESAKKFKCNLFFAFDGEGLHFEVCSRLKEVCGYSILWVTEDPYELHFNLQTMALFNKVFTNDSGSVYAYGEKGFHLPLAATEYIQYHPVCKDEQCLYDLFFAGTAWPNRVDLIRKVAGLLDGKIQLKLAMPTNQYLPEIKDFPFPLSFYNWRTSNLEFARFANRSRITLGLHRDFSATPGSATKALTPGPRIFEVAMAGGFQLIDQSLAEIDQYFVPNTEIVTFDGQKDCLEKIKYFLENPAQRIQITEAAQKRALAAHCYINRISAIFEVLKNDMAFHKLAHTKLENSVRPRILFLTHNVIAGGNWGGVEVYQDILRKNLDSSFEIFFFTADTLFLVKDYSLIDEHQNIIETFKFDDPMMENMLFSRERELIFSSLLMKYNIQLIHAHHFLPHSIGFIYIAKALGIPIIYSWHDYFGLCKNFNLIPKFIEKNVGYCEIEKNSIKQCELCLSASENIPPESQSIRREAFYFALKHIDILHYPSENVKDRVHSFYGSLDMSKEKVLGIPGYLTAKNQPLSLNKRLKAVIFGNFTQVKGADFLIEIIKRFNKKEIDIYLYGRVDPKIKESVYMALRDSDNFFYEGAYLSGEDTSLMLAGKDIALFASRWPETYSIALSEVVIAGLVPIAPNIGAYAERISAGINGYLYEYNDFSKVEEIINHLIINPALVQEAKENLHKIPAMTIDAHMPEITKLYHNLILQSHSSDKEFPIQEFAVQECGVLYNSSVWFGTQIPHGLHLDTTINEIISIQPSKGLVSRIFRFYKNYGITGGFSRLILGHDQFHSTHDEKTL
jgi:glycosyltransferase involved in cell wall biosynthesis/spore maturation protein CgeB